MDAYFLNFQLISSCDREFTNDFDILLKHFEVQKGIAKDYFCSNYSEISFGIRWMKGSILKHGTLKLLLKYFCNIN